MTETNNIERLTTALTLAVIERQVEKYELLNSVIYIEELSRKIAEGKIKDIDISELEALIKGMEIEEYDIFLELEEKLKELDMMDYLPQSIETKKGLVPSRDNVIEFILSSFSEFQRVAQYEEDLNPQLVQCFTNVLSKILISLYDKKIQEISEVPIYRHLHQEVKNLEKIISLIKESYIRVLTQDEKDKIYNYLKNSAIKGKIEIYIDLSRVWIEQARNTILEREESLSDNIMDLEKQITPEIIEKVVKKQQEQKRTIISQTTRRTKEEWLRLFDETKRLIDSSAGLTEEQKTILKRILLISTKCEIEEINLYEDILEEYKEISSKSRKKAYLDLLKFSDEDYGTIGIDLVLNLIPNLGNHLQTEISEIIKEITNKYNQHYLSQEEKQEIQELINQIEENYPNLAYVTYSDENMLYLEERFEELEGNKESLVNADVYNKHVLETDEKVDMFMDNTFKKIIKIKLEKLKGLLNTNKEDSQIRKGEIPKLRNELEFWLDKYEEYNISKEIQIPYKQYTLEEIQNINFGNRNAVIFLNGENGMTLYEEGILHNGLNKNGTFQSISEKKAREIIKKVVNGGRGIKDPEYYDFNTFVEKNNSNGQNAGSSQSKSNNHVIIANHELIRLSQKGNPTRITIINLNKIPEVNKKKIGINHENTVALVLGAHEINYAQHGKSYARIRAEAERYEEKIKTIVSAFENPATPRETLLKYIASSYGLLEKILGEQETPQHIPGKGGK